MSKKYDFYRGRIESCPLYGFKSGHEILEKVLHCAGYDPDLTDEEINSIMNLARTAHIKMLEDNYNEGWS